MTGHRLVSSKLQTLVRPLIGTGIFVINVSLGSNHLARFSQDMELIDMMLPLNMVNFVEGKNSRIFSTSRLPIDL
jgi:hypothetical protein